jgi:hypothetical protein
MQSEKGSSKDGETESRLGKKHFESNNKSFQMNKRRRQIDIETVCQGGRHGQQ